VTLADVLRRAAPWAAGVYGVFMALTAFWPTPVDQDAHATIQHILWVLHKYGMPHAINYSVVEFTANIALFLPVGLLVVAYCGMERWWLGFLVGFGASATIELGQLIFLAQRFPSVADVVANTTGAILGTVLALFVLTLWGARPVGVQAAVV
jgi:glycopeptide antibiotics resistance protein